MHATMGSGGKNVKEWNLDIHTKEWNQFKPNTYLSFLSLCLVSLMLCVKNNGSCTCECTSSTPCLADNYRLAWHWHYQYLGKLFPNYVKTDRNLLYKEERIVLSMVSAVSHSPLCGLYLSHVNLCLKAYYIATVSGCLKDSCFWLLVVKGIG